MRFDINKVQEYFNKINLSEEDKNYLKEDCRNFNIKAIFSIFDTNYDGKISKEEFEKVNKEEYNQFISELKTYNKEQGVKADNESIWTYGQLKGYLNNVLANEGAYTISEDEAYFDNIGTSLIKTTQQLTEDKQKFYQEKYNNEQTATLKDISQMTVDEIIAELKEYGIDTAGISLLKMKRELQKERENRAIYDSGSNDVDGKIGTFAQTQNNKLCSVLAELMNMSETEIQELYGEAGKTPETKIDENGEKYWEIQFPQDKNTDIKIKITENELNSGQITFTENDEKRTLGGVFPRGDADVTLITMAFVKRFGTSIMRGGAWAMQTKNKFSQEKYMDNQHLELLDDYSKLVHNQVGMLMVDEIERKGIECKDLKDEDLSFISKEERLLVSMSKGLITTLSDGRKACVCNQGIYLSDGTHIQPGHAMSVCKYNVEKNEIVLISNEFGNLSELKIPEELMVYFETASLKGVPGVKETPQPELTD